MPLPSSIADLSQTANSNSPAGSESPNTADDYLRTYASYIAQHRDGAGFTQEATVASAATADIGAATSMYVQITGTTTITSFGTNYNGPRFVRFAAALTLTHNATTLILPGGANITTAAGDTALVVPTGNPAAGWRVMVYTRGDNSTPTLIVGSGDATGTTTAGTIRGPARTGTDAAGVNTTIAAANGTGTGGSGAVIVQTAPAGTTGSTANTLTERVRVTAAGDVVLGSGEASGTTAGGTVRAPNRTGTNVAGADLTIQSGNGTGTGGSGVIAFKTAPAGSTGSTANTMAEVMRLDASGNLGLGVTPSAWTSSRRVLQLANGGAISTSDTTSLLASSNAYSDGTNWRYVGNGFASGYEQVSGQHRWNISGSGTAGNAITFTQAMTLDASGNLLVGTTSGGPFTTRLNLRYAGTTVWSVGPTSASDTFYISSTASSTGVYLLSNGTAWTSNSDIRLKTDLKPIQDAALKVSQIRAVTGRYKTDAEGVSRSFLIAQDVQSVLPEAVNVQNDEQGTLGLQYTDVIPLLTAAIQEQQAIIEDLKARVAALEA